jgi:hypothetical protein
VPVIKNRPVQIFGKKNSIIIFVYIFVYYYYFPFSIKKNKEEIWNHFSFIIVQKKLITVKEEEDKELR